MRQRPKYSKRDFMSSDAPRHTRLPACLAPSDTSVHQFSNRQPDSRCRTWTFIFPSTPSPHRTSRDRFPRSLLPLAVGLGRVVTVLDDQVSRLLWLVVVEPVDNVQCAGRVSLLSVQCSSPTVQSQAMKRRKKVLVSISSVDRLSVFSLSLSLCVSPLFPHIELTSSVEPLRFLGHEGQSCFAKGGSRVRAACSKHLHHIRG